MDIAILGAGAWGTALACVLDKPGVRVWLHGWCLERANELATERVNHELLPGVTLPPGVRVTSDYREAMASAKWVFLAVPTQALRSTLERIRAELSGTARLVSVCKGIETDSLMLVHQVIDDVLGEQFAACTVHLSGPSFAAEVARGLPTNLVAAAHELAPAEEVQALVSTECLRVYTSGDPVGVQVGGALKNVIAVAAGAAAGLGFGYNAQAALVTRGLAEMTRFAVGMGGQSQTLSGLSGLGDLILSASYDMSRNRRLGFSVGRGDSLPDALAKLGGVAEGYATAKAVYQLSTRHSLDVPISKNVYQVLYENKPVAKAVADLLGRPLKRE